MTNPSHPSPDADRPHAREVEPYGHGEHVPTGHHTPPPAFPGEWEDPEDDSLDWRRYLGAVVRHKWIVAAGVVLGLLGGVLVHQSIEPTYEVSSTVWIESARGGAAGDADPIRPSQLLSESGWVDLMRSFAVLDPVVSSLNLHVRSREPGYDHLFHDFEVTETVRTGAYEARRSADGSQVMLLDADGNEVDRQPRGQALGEGVGFSWLPPDEFPADGAVAFSVLRPREMARELAETLDVRIDRDATFLRVSLEGTDPERVTRIINGVVDRYVEVAEQLKRANLDELTGVLEEQLAYADENLEEAELALENFKVQTISLPSEQGSPVTPGLQQTQDPAFQNFFNLRIEQEEARRDRRAIERAMARSQEQGRLATEALEVIPSVRESSDLTSALQLAAEKRASLRALRLRYTDEHPSVQELQSDLAQLEQNTIPAMVDNLLSEVDERQREIDDFVGRASQELQAIPPRAVEETRLERRFESAEDLFRELQGRLESARLGAASTIPDVRVLDRAQIPDLPNNDQRLRMLLVAVMAGLGLGLAGAVVRDHVDPMLRRPDQVTRDLGLPILATIPHARSRNGSLRPEDQSQVVEAFRNLRLTLTYAQGGTNPLVLAISSPGIGDGKSFTTSNLALAFAELGKSTLIIDGDIRRGTMHTLFDRERKPGLTDYLAGDATVDEIFRATDHPSLQVIPSGSRFRDAPELLGQPEMHTLMELARDRFDVVLLDSAPLGAAVDPYLLGTHAGALLLVLRDGSTDKELAEARLHDLQRLPIHLVGAVLNAVPAGTGPYRYYSYLPGYDAVDEQTSSRGSGRALAGSGSA